MELEPAILQTLRALADLDAAFRKVEPGSVADQSETERRALVDLLSRLFVMRIEVLRCFELLLSLDSRKAIRLLFDLYLGPGVAPDRKFGGYEGELWVMLDDLVEIRGESALRELVGSPSFDRLKLGDPRLIRALCNVLSLEEPEQLGAWLDGVGIERGEWELIQWLGLGHTAANTGDRAAAQAFFHHAEQRSRSLALAEDHPYVRFLRFELAVL